jgi:CubicO group peptidase (beta-lactamase class C family)
MNPSRLAGAAALALSCLAAAPAAPLPRDTPEAQGISARAILAYVNAADATVDSMNSFILVRHGRVVAEGWWAPYAPAEPHLMFSLSKSFTSTAVGLAQSEGKLNIYDKLADLFPAEMPEHPGPNLAALRLRDLLRMSSGQLESDIKPFPFDSDASLVKYFLARPVTFKPGTHFVYNTPGTYMLSAAVQKATGQTVHDYLLPRLFEPLGIENPPWEESAQGISFGGFGLSLRTEDIARFGQLLLQRGQWRGRQLVPSAWVDQATALQTSNGGDPTDNWDQGYGYQFWRCPHGAYRGDGAFGQLCIVMPQYDAVLAVTAGTRDMAREINLVWEHLLPALKEGALPADPAADAELSRRLAALTLPTPAGVPSDLAPAVTGRKYVFAPNALELDSITLGAAAGTGATRVTVHLHGLDQAFDCGSGSWLRGTLETKADAWGLGGKAPIAASGAWTARDTYTALVCRYRTPITTAYRLTFTGDQVDLVVQANADLNGPPPAVQLAGHAAL